MITVYGTDWCEDTRRSLRHLRRLGVPHRYRNVDDDLEALALASSINGGVRRTPTIDLGVGGEPLVEPDNDTLTGALVELDMLTQDEAAERMSVQNVGDLERIARTLAGVGLIVSARPAPAVVRWPLRVLGAGVVLSGLSGWCPGYWYSGLTSLGGPGDRPDEAARTTWVSRTEQGAGAGPAAAEDAR